MSRKNSNNLLAAPVLLMTAALLVFSWNGFEMLHATHISHARAEASVPPPIISAILADAVIDGGNQSGDSAVSRNDGADLPR